MRRAASIMFLALVASGCAAQRYLPPPPLFTGIEVPADLTHIALTIDSVEITNQSETDLLNQDKREAMRRVFLQHLTTRASFGLFITDADRAEPPEHLEDVHVRVSFNVDETADRTIILDGLFFYPGCGIFPFTPQWGDAIVTGTIDIVRGTEHQLPLTVSVTAPYSIIFYSWYRVDPIEDAFKRAHQKLFDEMISRFVTRIGIRETKPPPVLLASTSTSAEMIVAAVEPPPKEITMEKRVAALTASLSKLQTNVPSNVILPPDEAGVIFRPFQRQHDDSFFDRYLSSLGGVEASITGGGANVQSRATTSQGLRQTVGTGDASSSGYRISLFKPPTVTGFFYPPTVGFLSETITITGFRDDTPLFSPPGSTTIPAIVSDPNSGGPVDVGAPIAYRLKLKSGHIGQAIGLNLVVGNEDVQFFSTALAGINIFEVRHSDVTFYTARVKGLSVAAFQSGNFGAQIGLAIPSLHVAVRAAAQIEWYAAFSYPERVEFQARSVFNQEKMIYERERVFVTGASLTTFDWQLSLVALF